MVDEKEFNVKEFEEKLKNNVEVFITSKPSARIPVQHYTGELFIELEPKEFLRVVDEFKPLILVKVPIVPHGRSKECIGTLYLFRKWDYTFFTIIRTKGEKNE